MFFVHSKTCPVVELFTSNVAELRTSGTDEMLTEEKTAHTLYTMLLFLSTP
jgi:hypothetical protein